MKNFLLSITLCLAVNFVFAEGSEEVCVLTNTGSSGTACTPTTLKAVDPCSSISFIVKNLTPPAGYVMVGKYEWYLNDVLAKTSTDPNDFGFNYIIAIKSFNVYCKVSYKTTGGTLSQSYKSTIFTPIIKDLNFDLITTSTPPANYGCTTGTVSFSLNTFTCSGPAALCDNILNVTQYNITWQAPSGWTQTSISTNGNQTHD